jgi:lipopolysaccharide biosynthesis regulator YciM
VVPPARTAGLTRTGSGGLSQSGGLAKSGGLSDPEAQRRQDQELIQLAVSYLRTGRTDNEAARVYSELVKLRNMDTATLTRLAEIFLARRDWQTLRLISERLEKQTKHQPPK